MPRLKFAVTLAVVAIGAPWAAVAASLIEAAEGRMRSGDVAAAREAALAAAALRPGEPRVHLILAQAHLWEHQVGEAVEEARRAVRLVLDTGLHAKGWTEDEAVAWAMANSARPEAMTL
jgi:Tfp pilus assembly protein PilF